VRVLTTIACIICSISVASIANNTLTLQAFPYAWSQQGNATELLHSSSQDNLVNFLSKSENFTIWPNIHPNVKTDFNPNVTFPSIQGTAFIHPFAIVIGDCYIGKLVLVAPTAVCRADEGTPIHVGDSSNMQDGVILHALETTDHGKNMDGRRFSSDGDRLLGNDSRFSQGYAVFIGDRVSLAHDSMVHGPAWIGNDTFLGMKSFVFNAKVGKNVAVGVSSLITGGVTIDDDRYVPPGSVITTQEQADLLPPRIGSDYEKINKAVINVNEQIAGALLAKAYDNQLAQLISQRESIMEESILGSGVNNSNSSSSPNGTSPGIN
jgi:carbonic anhydrase/acetyltransferase-like protein (isoleucine patch superfamily)